MKQFLISLFVFVASIQAQADSAIGSGVVVAGLVGTTSALGYQNYIGLLSNEPDDWKQDSTNSTAKLFSQCGLNGEIRILRNNRFNRVFLGLQNSETKPVTVRLDRTRVRFPEGLDRIVMNTPQAQAFEVKPNWYMWTTLVIPRKEDFRDQKTLIVEIPTASETGALCNIDVKLDRNPDKPASVDTYLSQTSFEVALNFGGDFARSGSLNSAGNLGGLFDLQMYGYGNANNGLYLGIQSDSFNSANVSQLNNLNTSYTNPRFQMNSFQFGYSYRHLITEKSFYKISPGLGYADLQLRDTNGGSGNTVDYGLFEIPLNLTYEYRFARVVEGWLSGDWALTGNLEMNFIPNQTTQSNSFGGVTMGATVGIQVGY